MIVIRASEGSNTKLLAILIVAILAVAMAPNTGAVYWSSSVDAGSSHWYIYRESSNISFVLSSQVEGTVSPIEVHGKILSPYQSYYEEIGVNDVRLRERISSMEGSYKSADEIELYAAVSSEEINIKVNKPVGSNVYTIEYRNENWPVFINCSRSLEYSGKSINNRDFEGNNGDYVGSNFLYNHEISKEQRSVIWLQRMNATVKATDESILLAELKPTKYLSYQIEAKTTGIADWSYQLRDPKYDIKHQNYPALSTGEDRYYGKFYLERRIEMSSIHNETDPLMGWLSCCSEGNEEINPIDAEKWNESTIFEGV